MLQAQYLNIGNEAKILRMASSFSTRHPHYRYDARVFRVSGIPKKLRELETRVLDEKTNIAMEVFGRMMGNPNIPTISDVLIDQGSMSSCINRLGRCRGCQLNFRKNLFKDLAEIVIKEVWETQKTEYPTRTRRGKISMVAQAQLAASYS